MKNSMSLANGSSDNSKTVYANRCSECKKVVIDKRLIMEIPMASSNILYYCGKIVGGIYDDRLLVKPVKSAVMLMPEATYELPYEGAKEMLLVDDVDNKEFLAKLFRTMYEELPATKKK